MNDTATDGARPRTETPVKTLVVVLHGWKLGATSMEQVKEVALQTYGANLTKICAPRLAYADRLKSVRATRIVRDVLAEVDACVENQDYERIVFVGHSFGATIARRVFLVASGNPSNFCPEDDLCKEKPRAWATKVERIVLLAAFNRGWMISDRTSWHYSAILNVVGILGHLSPKREWSPSIFDFRLGAPFMVQTRLHWMAYRRARLEQLRQKLDVHRPILVQLIGTQDDLIAPFDQVDISVDGTGRALISGAHDLVQKVGGDQDDDRDYFLIETPFTDHETAVALSGGGRAAVRRELFTDALTQNRSDLDGNVATHDPALLSDEVDQVDETVKDTVFVMHGIRDDGFWTHRIAERVRLTAGKVSNGQKRTWVFRSWTPSYGYFAMLAFMLPWIRRQKVEWFMDQYVSAFAQYPKSDFHYVGHSNGTYLAARGLQDYPALHLKNVLFAGSVVRTNFPWHKMVEVPTKPTPHAMTQGLPAARVQKFQNIVASADWIVAWLPKCVDHWWRFDLGGGGFDGFGNKGVAIHEARVVGGHGAGVAEEHWGDIAEFIVEATPISTKSGQNVVHPFCINLIGTTRIFVPLLIAIFAVAIPLSCLWLHWSWPFALEWSAGSLPALVAYLGLLGILSCLGVPQGLVARYPNARSIVLPLLVTLLAVALPAACLFLHVPWSWTFEWSAWRLLILTLYLGLLRFVVTRF